MGFLSEILKEKRETGMNRKNRTVKRKIRRIKRMTARFTLVFFLLLFISLSAGTLKSFAGAGSQSPERTPVKHYTSVLIYPGDSILSLAEKYHCDGIGDTDSLAHEILSINHLSPDKDLQPGNHIIVPVYY